MKSSAMTKLFAGLLFAALTQVPAFGACTKESCSPIGPPLGPCTQVVYDNLFDDTSCTVWQTTGDVIDGGDYYELEGLGGSLYQDVGTLPNDDIDVKYEIQVFYANAAGTEQLRVELVNASTGSVIQTIGTHNPSYSSDGTYSYQTTTANHSGVNARLRFRILPGANPGIAAFRITRAYLWSVEY
ncbi:MAG TPA: hypothetical protein VHK90_01180 [Thermoanaerobaculia bacterium]|nr:hypothetical protein [Thermoanaerobaculia bacterium]